MNPDLTGILIFTLLGGGIMSFIGAIIKFFNAGDILNFYNKQGCQNKTTLFILLPHINNLLT